jgi:hypothetical protein
MTNKRIVERAADLWVKLLQNPRYDNGDSSQQGGMAAALAVTLPSNATDERLAAFRTELIRLLMQPGSRGMLDVDYQPDRTLSAAAKVAGLEMQFPWKTTMFLEEGYLSLTAGYGAGAVYHYPLKDGRWLVTRLQGGDIDKVIDYVQGGKPKFVIE